MGRSAVVHRLKRVVDKGFLVLAGGGDSISLCVEKPLAGERTVAAIELQGWAMNPDGAQMSGVVVVNGTHQFPLEFNESRTDVAEAFSLPSSRAHGIGFHQYIPWEDIGDTGEEVTVSLVARDGIHSVQYGPVSVFRELPSTGMRVCLESPISGDLFSERIDIRGWVVTSAPERVQATAYIDNRPVGTFGLTELRADVVSHFKLQPDQARTGYFFQIPWSETGAKDEESVVLSIDFRLEDQLVRLGPISLLRTRSQNPNLNRRLYKEVWNSASENHNDAMLAVAGMDDYETFMASGISSAITIRETLGISSEDLVLEIGCGTGRIGRALASHCRAWVGADISGKMLRYAKDNLRDQTNVTLVELGGTDLSEFENSCFDHVYCSAVFMHLEEWDRYRYVAEAFRVLKPGGKVYIDNLNLAGERGWAVFMDLFRVDPIKRLPQISKCSTAEELTTYLRNAGFVKLQERREPLLVTAWGEKPAVIEPEENEAA